MQKSFSSHACCRSFVVRVNERLTCSVNISQPDIALVSNGSLRISVEQAAPKPPIHLSIHPNLCRSFGRCVSILSLLTADVVKQFKGKQPILRNLPCVSAKNTPCPVSQVQQDLLHTQPSAVCRALSPTRHHMRFPLLCEHYQLLPRQIFLQEVTCQTIVKCTRTLPPSYLVLILSVAQTTVKTLTRVTTA